MGLFSFEPISANEAEKIWELSPHSSAFTNPQILQHLSKKVYWWLSRKGNEPVCIWPVCLPDGENVGLPEFTYYIGPIWAANAFQLPNHRWLSFTTQVYEGFIETFLKSYGEIRACLPRTLTDIRVFDWWNYHSPEKPRFALKPRYTTVIEDLQSISEEEIFKGFRELRKREIRKIKKLPPPVQTHDWKSNDLIRLYSEVMARQEAEVSENTIKLIPKLVDLVKRNLGQIVAYKDSEDGKIIAALLMLYGPNDANMVLNVVANSWRDTGLPAWMVFNSILTAKNHGLNIFDFNGANSPSRGDDKHSYGSRYELYFDIQLK